MKAYDAEFLDDKNVRCICSVAESNHDKALEKLKRLWTVKKVIRFERSRHLEVVKSSPEGLDTFKLTYT
jgi:thioester reductase-like protein